MNRIEEELFHLCTCFLQLLERARKEGDISQQEYEIHSQLKKDFIDKNKNELSK